jgi:hypothetical protein
MTILSNSFGAFGVWRAKGAGSFSRIEARTSIIVRPSNGARPVTIS